MISPSEFGRSRFSDDSATQRRAIPDLKTHERECVETLGEPWTHVHEWLDAYFAEMGPSHRRMRHHREGVEEARRLWGDDAARAAEIHIKADCGGRVPKKSDYEDKTVDNQGMQVYEELKIIDRRRLLQIKKE